MPGIWGTREAYDVAAGTAILKIAEKVEAFRGTHHRTVRSIADTGCAGTEPCRAGTLRLGGDEGHEPNN